MCDTSRRGHKPSRRVFGTMDLYTIKESRESGTKLQVNEARHRGRLSFSRSDRMRRTVYLRNKETCKAGHELITFRVADRRAPTGLGLQAQIRN